MKTHPRVSMPRLIMYFVFSIVPVYLGAAQEVLLTHANILSMNSEDILEDAQVLIRQGKIVSINKTGDKLDIPARTPIIDLQGSYLMPGLIDCHVHLFDQSELTTYLKYGVTTVLNMDGSPEHLRWRNNSDRSDFMGSRMLTAGQTLDGYPPLNWMFWAIETPEQARAAVRMQKAKGYDFIKIYGTLNPDVFDAVQEEATLNNLTVLGHVPRQVGVAQAMRKNFRLIAHGDDLIASSFNSFPTDRQLDSLAQIIAAGNFYVAPNLAIHQRALDEIANLDSIMGVVEAGSLSPSVYSQWIKSNNRTLDQYNLEEYEGFVRKMQGYNRTLTACLNKYKVRIVAGTDAATLGYPGSSLIAEIRELELAGLSRFEALEAGTRTAGDFITDWIDPQLKLGRIEEGYEADFLILKVNPLTARQPFRSLSGVVLKGMYYRTEKLATKVALQSEKYGEAKGLVASADQLFEEGKVKAGLSNLRRARRQVKYQHVFAQWVLGIKAQRLSEQSPALARELQNANAAFYPEHFAVYNELGQTYYKMRAYEPAAQYTRTSLELAPENAVAVRLDRKIRAAQQPFNNILSGDYLLEKVNRQGKPIDSLEISIVKASGPGHSYEVHYRSREEVMGMVSAEGQSNQIWFTIPGQYGTIEYSVLITEGVFSGTFAGPFGNNGELRITFIH